MAETETGVAIIPALYDLIRARRDNPPPGSYTSSLFEKGRVEIVKKLGEEAVEVVVAATAQTRDRVVYESADLIYHLLVLLVEQGVAWEEIEAELAKRRK